MKKLFIARLAILACGLHSFLAYGQLSDRHEGEPHLNLAPPQFEQHFSHVSSLLDSWEFDQALRYAESVENLPEEWKEYLITNTYYEIIVPEERCFEHATRSARNEKLPDLIRSRLYIMALNCRYVYRKNSDSIFSEIFSFKNIDPGYLQIALKSLQYAHIGPTWRYRLQGRGNITDVVSHVIHAGSEHYYYFMASFRVSEDGSGYDMDIVKSWPEVHDQSRFIKQMDFNHIQHSANPGDRVIVYFLFTPFTAH